jgi:hypothetical protein
VPRVAGRSLAQWYGWHFPELGKIIPDNLMYARAVRAMGVRTTCKTTDFSSFMPEEVETEMKEAAEISMGTEVSEEDVANIMMLTDQARHTPTPQPAHPDAQPNEPVRERVRARVAPAYTSLPRRAEGGSWAHLRSSRLRLG